MAAAPRPSADEEACLYRRLLAGEPDAPADLVKAFLLPLLDALHPHGNLLPDPTLVDNIVVDTLLRFPYEPHKYGPTRGRSLWSYLYMDALGDLKNEADKERRRQRGIRLISFDDPAVAESEQDRNEGVEAAVIRWLSPPAYLPEGVDADRLHTEVEAILANATDRRVVEMILAGVRETEQYVAVLNISHLPVAEQRRRVKQEKDRWRIRLKRLGATLNDAT